MAMARYKDLCIDTGGGEALGRFWAAALGLAFEPDDDGGKLRGPTPQHRVWMNTVPEAKAVKHRVHIDMHTGDVSELTGLGASVLEAREDWTVLADPEGGEFCTFLREDVPAYRFYELNVDSAEPEMVARWWAEVLGVPAHADEPNPWWYLDDVPGLPFEHMVFAPVPEPKAVKNRIHWDVSVDDLQPLLDHGATLLRPQGGDIEWHVLADPEGNEFCAFVD